MRSEKELIVIATPDDEALAEITEVQRLAIKYFGWVKPQKVETLHMTICPLGAWDGEPGSLESARRICSQVQGRPSTTTLIRGLSFGLKRKKPYVLAAAKADPDFLSLKHQIVDALRASGVKGESKSMTPHVSLNWGHGLVPEHALKRPIQWRTRGIDLIISHIGEARHELIERWLFKA